MIGLGNTPEAKYKNTYHSVGILFAEYFKRDVLGSKQFINARLSILTSGVYMNNSGIYVKRMKKEHNAEAEETLIVHDDSDIEIGNYKLTEG